MSSTTESKDTSSIDGKGGDGASNSEHGTRGNDVDGIKMNFNEVPYTDCVSLVCEGHGRKLEDFRDFCSKEGLEFESTESFYLFCVAENIELARGLLFVEHSEGGPTASTFDMANTILPDCPLPTFTIDGTYVDDNGAPPGLVKVIKVTCIVAAALGHTHMKPMYDRATGAYACILGPLNDFECTVAVEALKGLKGTPGEQYASIIKAPRTFFTG